MVSSSGPGVASPMMCFVTRVTDQDCHVLGALQWLGCVLLPPDVSSERSSFIHWSTVSATSEAT